MINKQNAVQIGAAALITAIILILIYLNFENNFPAVNEASIQPMAVDNKEYALKPTNDEMPRSRLPNAIIAGCGKCGTRALLWLLSLHPDVKHVGPEIHFFDRDENYQKGLEWYKELFPPRLEHQIGIEKSPSYFVVESVPKRIHEMDSSVKIIIIVCEPVKKAISRFTQHLDKSPRRDELDFKSTIYGENEAIDPSKGSVKEGMYITHLQNWLKWFPLDQMLFLDGDQFKVDPLPQLRKVEEFLNIPHVINETLLVYDKTKGFYCVVKDDVQCLGDGKGRPHPEIDPEIKQKLASFYAPLNKEFQYSIGKLYNWDVWN